MKITLIALLAFVPGLINCMEEAELLIINKSKKPASLAESAQLSPKILVDYIHLLTEEEGYALAEGYSKTSTFDAPTPEERRALLKSYVDKVMKKGINEDKNSTHSPSPEERRALLQLYVDKVMKKGVNEDKDSTH
jgi:hypothetical protein